MQCNASVILANMEEGTGMKRFLKMFACIYTIFCAMGCLIQIGIVTKSFFMFEIDTRMDITFPDVYDGPALSVCYRVAEIVNVSAFNQKYNMSMQRPFGPQEHMKMVHYITLGDMFTMSAGTGDMRPDLIESCIVRVPGQYRILYGNSSVCSYVFTQSRFQIGEFMCTDYTAFRMPQFYFETNDSVVKSNETQDPKSKAKDEAVWKHGLFRMAYAVSYPSTFFLLKFKTEAGLDDVNLVRPVIHSAGSLPFISIALAPKTWRNYDDYIIFSNDVKTKFRGNNSRNVNKFLISYSSIFVSLLPYPYTDKCLFGYRKNKCLAACIQDAFLTSFNKLPFVTINSEQDLEKNPHFKVMNIFSASDLKNKTLSVQSKKVEIECSEKCPHFDCTNDYSLTRMSTAVSLDQSRLTMYVGTPDEPNVSVVSKPRIPANDYFLLILSLIGFWLGLSAQDLNIIHYIVQRQEKKQAKKSTDRKPSLMTLHQIQKQKQSSYCVKSRQLLWQVVERETKAAMNALLSSMPHEKQQ